MSLAKILVPLDGSRLAEKALSLATSFAAKSNASICLVTVAGSKDSESKLAEHEIYLTGIAKSLEQRGFSTCFHISTGETAAEIIKVARDENVDHIVMTTHGRSGIARAALGSVTDAVALHAPLPVIVARADIADDVARGEPLRGAIIVPLDGSELAETALEEATVLVSAFGSSLLLLRVIGEDAEQSEVDQAEEYMKRIIRRVTSSGINAESIVTRGHPGQSIVAAMEERPHSLVVLTTRGASGLVRLTRGSVADWLVHKAPGPVVVISPTELALLGQAIH